MFTSEQLHQMATIHKKYREDMETVGFVPHTWILLEGIHDCELPVKYSKLTSISTTIQASVVVDGIEFYEYMKPSDNIDAEVARLNAEEQKKCHNSDTID